MANTKSLSLNGSSQYAYAADSASLSITGDISLEAWIKLDTLDHKIEIVTKANDDTVQYSWMWQIEATGKINAAIFSVANGSTSGEWSSTSAVIEVGDLGTWVHLAVTIDVSESTGCVMYKNGSSVSVAAKLGTSTSIADSTSKVFIGAYSDTITYPLDGLIDEARIWNDIRTPTEIINNYSIQLVGNEAGLVAYYKFNDAGGGEGLLDETANNNDLTLVGSPTYSTDIPFVDSTSPSVSSSISPSVSSSISFSMSISPSISSSISLSSSPSISSSLSPSISPSLSQSSSLSPSLSLSFSPSTSISPSVSPSVSISVSPSPSPEIKINPKIISLITNKKPMIYI